MKTNIKVLSAPTKETADDAQLEQRVTIPKTALVKAEFLLERVGLKEAEIPLDLHHFLVGAVSYMLIHPTHPKSMSDISKTLVANRTKIKLLDFSALES